MDLQGCIRIESYHGITSIWHTHSAHHFTEPDFFSSLGYHFQIANLGYHPNLANHLIFSKHHLHAEPMEPNTWDAKLQLRSNCLF